MALAVVAARRVQTLSFGSTQGGLSCALVIVCKTRVATHKPVPSDVAACGFADRDLVPWGLAQAEQQTDKSDPQPLAKGRGESLKGQSWELEGLSWA